jgi:hypothetical protein
VAAAASSTARALCGPADDRPPRKGINRIGNGPWINTANAEVAANIDELHSAASKMNVDIGRSENGRRIPGRQYVVNQHDILTGSTPEGRAFPPGKDMTCGNWKKNGKGAARVGHHDRMSGRTGPLATTWNSAHLSRGCSAAALRSSGGAGLPYCFAVKKPRRRRPLVP